MEDGTKEDIDSDGVRVRGNDGSDSGGTDGVGSSGMDGFLVKEGSSLDSESRVLGGGFVIRVKSVAFGVMSLGEVDSEVLVNRPIVEIESGILGMGGSFSASRCGPKGEGGNSLFTGDMESVGSSVKPFAYIANSSSIPISSSCG